MAEETKACPEEETEKKTGPEEKAENPKTEEKEDKKKKREKAEKVPKADYDRLQAEFESHKQQYLRVLAEYDNFRKRSQNEKNGVYNNAISDAVNAILPVADNIDRALAQENASAEDMRKGVEMIANQFKACFEKLGITEIGAAGETFDPNFHNAVMSEETDDYESGKVSGVMQKGYTLNGKVIRPSMVKVAG